MKRILLAVGVSIVCGTSQVQAAPVTFTFTGIQQGQTSVTPTIQNGQTVTGTFTWDTSAVPIIDSLGALGSYAYYAGQATMVTIGTQSFNLSGFSTTGALVFEDLTGTTGYRIDDENQVPGGGIFDFRLYSTNPSLVTSYALPSTLPDITRFDQAAVLYYGGNGTLATINLTDVEPMPEPASLALISVPLAAFGFLRRRQRVV